LRTFVVLDEPPRTDREVPVEITDNISAAISQHEQAVNAVSEALGPYRGDRADLAPDDRERRLDDATHGYETSSLLLTGLIVQQLVVPSDGEEANLENGQFGDEGDFERFDAGATTRLTILIGIDARIAAQAGSLNEAQIPAPGVDVSYPRPLTKLELKDLGPPLADVCEPLFSELRQDDSKLDHDADEPPPSNPASTASGASARPDPAGPAPGTPAQPGPVGVAPGAPDVKPLFDAVLVQAGGDIFGTIASSLSWLNRISAVLGDATASLTSWSSDALKQGMSALHKLSSASWRQVLTKVLVLAGDHLSEIGALGADLVRAIQGARELFARGTGILLGTTLRIEEVRVQAQTLVNADPGRAGAAIAACQQVVKHHKKRRRAVPWLNRALPMSRMIPAYGVGVEAIAAATLVIYSIWLAHDHLDSPVLARLRLPKNPGMLSEIRAVM
jgi:hypothetical protein